jgi:hypothetical protein
MIEDAKKISEGYRHHLTTPGAPLDERKVIIYKKYFLPANHFILSIYDLTKTDLKDLDALTNRYLKSWLGMPQSESFSPVHSGHGMDVKNVSLLYKDRRSLDIGRTLT